MNWLWFLLFFTIMATLNLVLAMKRDKEKLGKSRFLHIILYIISVLAAAFGFYNQHTSSQAAKLQNLVLKSEVTNLSEHIEYLQGQQQILLDGNKAILNHFDLLKANSDTVKSLLKTDRSIDNQQVIIPNNEKQLVEVAKSRKESRKGATGNVITSFLFRSRNVTPLREVRIEMQFDKPVINVATQILGAFVIEQGTRDTLINSTKYLYQTEYLSQSNDIQVVVESVEPIQLKIWLAP